MPSAPKQDFKQEFNQKREVFTNGTIHEEEDFEKPAAIEVGSSVIPSNYSFVCVSEFRPILKTWKNVKEFRIL